MIWPSYFFFLIKFQLITNENMICLLVMLLFASFGSSLKLEHARYGRALDAVGLSSETIPQQYYYQH